MQRLPAPVYQLKRRAKRIVRDEGIALHAALDRVAQSEGFARWSLLTSQATVDVSPTTLLPRLSDGDLLLIGARPGHGKTRLGLQLLIEAVRQGRRAVFFTLEYTERETHRHLRSLGGSESDVGRLEIVASDDICAGFIARHLSGAPRGTVAVIDYLQILDQRRSKPPLAEQLCDLRHLAQTNGFVLGFISQIDRRFDPAREPLPDLRDIRLPNPIETTIFSKTCFLHDGAMRFQSVM